MLDDLHQLDRGMQSSVALHSSGLVLEFHVERYVRSIQYRIGKLTETSVTWGPLLDAGISPVRYWPAVALTKDGTFVLVYSDREHKSQSQLFYRIGWIDPHGDEWQRIEWKTGDAFWDSGFHTSVAMNDNGLIVSVHETHGSSNSLYYRIGHFKQYGNGAYAVEWYSGHFGIEYEAGINPHIAVNNLNQVVEVHQVPGETLLHYRRGIVSGGRIAFSESRRYDNHAEQPAVALLDNGFVLEVHSLGGLISRTGTLSTANNADIDWAEPIKLNPDNDVVYPALATNGIDVIQTHENNGYLDYSTTKVCQPYQETAINPAETAPEA
jgi:hypothetical protein